MKDSLMTYLTWKKRTFLTSREELGLPAITLPKIDHQVLNKQGLRCSSSMNSSKAPHKQLALEQISKGLGLRVGTCAPIVVLNVVI